MWQLLPCFRTTFMYVVFWRGGGILLTGIEESNIHFSPIYQEETWLVSVNFCIFVCNFYRTILLTRLPFLDKHSYLLFHFPAVPVIVKDIRKDIRVWHLAQGCPCVWMTSHVTQALTFHSKQEPPCHIPCALARPFQSCLGWGRAKAIYIFFKKFIIRWLFLWQFKELTMIFSINTQIKTGLVVFQSSLCFGLTVCLCCSSRSSWHCPGHRKYFRLCQPIAKVRWLNR